MVNLKADQPTNFALTQCDDSYMLRLSHLNDDMSKMKNNMITCGKGLEKRFFSAHAKKRPCVAISAATIESEK